MNTISINTKTTNINFSAVSLNQKETSKSMQLLLRYKNADNQTREKLTSTLFKIFEKKLNEESIKHITKWSSKDDIRQDFYLNFLEGIIEAINFENPLEYILNKVNTYKSGKNTLTTEFANMSLDRTVYSPLDKTKTTFADLLTEESTTSAPKSYDSEIIKFYNDKAQIDKTLTEKERIVYDLYLDGLNPKRIAQELQITETRVLAHILVVIEKIKNFYNTTNKRNDYFSNTIAKHFSLKKEDLKNLFIKNPSLLNLDVQTIIDRIASIAKILHSTPESCIQTPNLLALKPETIINNIQNSSKELNIDENLFIQMATKHKSLLYAKPETLKQKVHDLSISLNTAPKNILKIASFSPNILTTNQNNLITRIRKLAQVLQISDKECITLYQKYPFLISRNIDSLIQNMEKTAKLLNISFGLYIKMAKHIANLIYQKPETIYNNVQSLSKLFQIPQENLITSFTHKPQLLIQKPQTIFNNVEKLAKGLNISIEEMILIGLKAPQIFSQKPETILSNIKTYAKLSNISLSEAIHRAHKQANLFTYNPMRISKNNNIINFYSLIRNKNNTSTTARMNSTQDLYAAILRYLIKSTGVKDFPSSRKIYEITKEYILSHPDQKYSFELPAHDEYENFVDFANQLSLNLLGKNIFTFKQKNTL